MLRSPTATPSPTTHRHSTRPGPKIRRLDFLSVEHIRVELRFAASASSVPAAQRHALYPPAPAYFEFACPFGDCDGAFDLNGVASPLLMNSNPQANGTIQCSGSRTCSGMTRQPCNLRADYWITAQYQASSGPKG